MKHCFNIDGKKISEIASDENLQKFLKKNNYTSVKYGCSHGTCGNCMILLNDKPVPSCKISFSAMQSEDNIVTLSYFQKKYPEAKDIAKGFEKAGIYLCGFCDAGKYFTAYDLIKNEKPSRQQILDSISHLNTCCTDTGSLCEGILFAYDFKVARKNREAKSMKMNEESELIAAENDVLQNLYSTTTYENQSSEIQTTEDDEQYMEDKNNRFIFPSSLSQVFTAMERYPKFKIISGGTYQEDVDDDDDLFSMEQILEKDEAVICLKKVPELNIIDKHERYIEIGAAVTLNQILEMPRIPQVLCESIKQIGSHSMRNISTIGGNICLPGKRGSTWSALLALDAKFEIMYKKNSKETKKIIRAYDFETLQEKSILSKIRIPINDWTFSIYKRLGPKKFNINENADFTFLAETEREHIYNIRLAFSGAAKISHQDEISRGQRKLFHKRIKYGYISDLIGQKLPLQEKTINTCMSNTEKKLQEKLEGRPESNSDQMAKQQFETLLRLCLESLN